MGEGWEEAQAQSGRRRPAVRVWATDHNVRKEGLQRPRYLRLCRWVGPGFSETGLALEFRVELLSHGLLQSVKTRLKTAKGRPRGAIFLKVSFR